MLEIMMETCDRKYYNYFCDRIERAPPPRFDEESLTFDFPHNFTLSEFGGSSSTNVVQSEQSTEGLPEYDPDQALPPSQRMLRYTGDRTPGVEMQNIGKQIAPTMSDTQSMYKGGFKRFI